MDSDEDTGVVQYEAQFDDTKEYVHGVLPNKSKYYKQTYRQAWEQMPDFKGWLRGVPGQPTRAFCTYCQKSLHAHRLSLLKHTCTIRHQKAAQSNMFRNQKNDEIEQSNQIEMNTVDIVIAGTSHEEEVEELEPAVTFETIQEDEENEIIVEEHVEDDEDEDESYELEDVKLTPQKPNRVVRISDRPVISTHVLDTSKGQPVSGLQVSLYKLIDGRWTYINEGLTSSDGRFSHFLAREAFTAGRYKLHFDVDRYFEIKKQDTLYPFIEIVFDCRAPLDHYHIPLLLSPYGYSTYRGT